MNLEQELIFIKVGHKTLALPLNDVEHILPLSNQTDALSGGALLYQDQAVSWLPLWAPLGESSSYQEFDELLAQLPLRRQDHIDWMTALEHSLRQDTPFSKARSPYECTFGKWFYAYRTDNRRLRLLLDQFEMPHARIHALADQLLNLSHNGQLDTALERLEVEKTTTLASLLQLFDSVHEMLPSLKRQLAVIVQLDGERYGLGVDAVQDVAAVTADRLRPAHGSFGQLQPEAFVIGDGAELTPLLNTRHLVDLANNTTGTRPQS